MGQGIDDEYTDYSPAGGSVSISSDRNMATIGAPANDNNDVDAGHVCVHEYNATSENGNR